ncbi:MAG TPA: FAD-dependent monooxygenase [Nitrospirota bacterium]|nr:FAD-dependent monooxygenase [Nitrospirota bacterium]
MTIPPHTDVLIAGAGPTGLMLGVQLARRGVHPLIVDRNPGPSVFSKALGVHARSLEIYSHLGIAERALELGMRAAAADLWVEGRRAARVPLGDIGRDLSPYPFLLILAQDKNEQLLGEVLHSLGGEVSWNTELIDIEQRTGSASAVLRLADGSTRTVEARWVAGCDGPHSVVRELCGIDFLGAPYEHVFYVADTTATGPMAPTELNVYLRRNGFQVFFPMRGQDRWRVVGILPRELSNRDNLEFAAVAPSIREQVGPSLMFQECRWFSTYRIHHRRAERFRDRRCFLLGDAAHIHSPVGGQGMNTGLQDAYNLAWKLALVIEGRAGEELLDSYETERLPNAIRLLRTTDRAFSFIVSSRWLAGSCRIRVLGRAVAFAMGRDRMQKSVFRTISQIGISYPASFLSEALPGLPVDAPQAGDRFPWLHLRFSPTAPPADLFERLDDTRLNLIMIGNSSLPPIPPELDGLLVTHRVPDDPSNDQELERFRIPKRSFYLLRPDGHIGLAGVKLDAALLRRYLSERLVLRKADTKGFISKS